MGNSERKPTGIQSVEVAGTLLKAFVELPGPASLTQLSGHSRITPTKARRYLVSLIRAGLVSQSQETGRYELGPLALSIGLTALGQFDVMRNASQRLTSIREQTGETTFLSVKSVSGASIIEFRESNGPIALTARVGATLPFLTTATGWTFVSFDPDVEAEMINEWTGTEDRAPLTEVLRGHDSIAARAASIRDLGYVHLEGVFQVGTCAISAPVFDLRNRLIASLTVVLPRERATSDRISEIGTILGNSGKLGSASEHVTVGRDPDVSPA